MGNGGARARLREACGLVRVPQTVMMNRFLGMLEKSNCPIQFHPMMKENVR